MTSLLVGMIFLLLAFLAPVLGSIGGVVLARLAKEELRAGKPYFLLLRKAFLAVLFLTLLFHTPLSLIAALGFLLGIGGGLLLRSRPLLLGLVMVSAVQAGQEILLLLSSLVFLYNLPFAASFPEENTMKGMASSFVMYAAPFLFLFTPFPSHPFFAAFAAGTIFLRA